MAAHRTVARAVRHPVQTTTEHPAETSPWVALVIAALASVGVTLSTEQYQVLLLVVAALPVLVTWFVNWRRDRAAS